MIELNHIYNEDCLQGMRRMPDGCVDLVITDPPYLIGNQGVGFWSKNTDHTANHYNARGTRKGMERLGDMKDGFDDVVLGELCRLMKKINLYIFCSQKQIRRYLDYFVGKMGCNWNLLCWHKTNPIPACWNKYLNDTEYILFFRERGVRVYGSYETKRTFYTSLRNQEDNVRYAHPTVKPVGIVRNFILNSSEVGGVVFDPFIGSGTTAVAACIEGRQFVGFEIDEGYYKTAVRRVSSLKKT
jgi:DNA modification methylase